MIAIMLAVAITNLPPVPQGRVRAPITAVRAGRTAYEQRCAACHGVDLRGGPNAPSIRGVGAADADFWMSTGRMPAAVPWVEAGHHVVSLPQSEIAAIVAYVVSVAPGGPPIPIVTANGDADRGRVLFQENCMHCHGVNAEGASIGGRSWAPPLDAAPVTQVAEAIRAGPGEMPMFGEQQLGQRDLTDIVTYLSDRRDAAHFTGLPLASGGPVPEGLLGWIAAGVLALAAYAFSPGTRRKKQ